MSKQAGKQAQVWPSLPAPKSMPPVSKSMLSMQVPKVVSPKVVYSKASAQSRGSPYDAPQAGISGGSVTNVTTPYVAVVVAGSSSGVTNVTNAPAAAIAASSSSGVTDVPAVAKSLQMPRDNYHDRTYADLVDEAKRQFEKSLLEGELQDDVHDMWTEEDYDHSELCALEYASPLVAKLEVGALVRSIQALKAEVKIVRNLNWWLVQKVNGLQREIHELKSKQNDERAS